MSSPPFVYIIRRFTVLRSSPVVCVEEYIPVGTPSPFTPSSRATTGMQHNDIQHPDHKAEVDLECLR